MEHVEWTTADGAHVEVLPKGTYLRGYEEPVTAEYGLKIDGLVIEGTDVELVELLGRCIGLVTEAIKQEAA